MGFYGLDKAFPGRLQEELLDAYRRISEIWHRWLKLLEEEEELEAMDVLGNDKRERGYGPSTPRKRKRMVDSGAQTSPTTPGKAVMDPALMEDVNDSPITKRLKTKIADMVLVIRLRKDALELKRKEQDLRDRLNI